MLSFLFVYIPFEIAFLHHFVSNIKLFANEVVLTILMLEIFCKMNMAYFSNGILITQRKLIFQHYCKNVLLTDFLGLISISFEFFVTLNENERSRTLYRLCKFLIFIKFFQFKQLYSEIVQYFKLEIYLKGTREMIELLCGSVFLAHFIACFWYLAALISLQDQTNFQQKTWLIKPEIVDVTWQTQYLYSFYWAVTTIMTVGFGDITPTNNIEIGFCIVSIFVGCAFYAYNLNKIGLILQKIYKEENHFKEEMRIINNFMERKKIDSGLQTRITEYLKFIWNEKRTQHTAKEMEIINTLSSSLKEELLLESYGGIIKSFPLLYKKFSEKTLKAMVSCIKEIKFVPGDYISYVIFIKNKIF